MSREETTKKAEEALLPKMALLGKTAAVISGTMAALTAAGWAITRKNQRKKEER